MSARNHTPLLLAALCLALAALVPANAAASPAPAWTLTATSEPANFAPGGDGEYVVVATNVGAEKTSGSESELVIKVPAGLTVTATSALNSTPGTTKPACTPAPAQVITCKTAEPIGSSQLLVAQVQVKATSAPEGTPLSAEAAISGGGATEEITASATTQIQKDPVPFDFLPGFNAPLTEEDGEAATLAGHHPYQQTISFGFPTQNLGSGLTNDGHPRNVKIELPRGLLGNPAATPVLCTEAELVGAKGCPLESQVGIVGITSLVGEVGNNTVITSNLYNMVAPPGSAAEFATNAADAGVFIHVLAGVRSDSDYGIEASTPDIIAFGQQPIFNVGAQVWGDPSAEAHDAIRGECRASTTACPHKVTRQERAFITLPGDCPAPPLFKVLADTWEEPSPPFGQYETSYESADRSGVKPASIEDCGALEFEPTIQTRLSTNLADSPSGLEVTVHQPQEEPQPEPLNSKATAILKDAVIAFPAGLTVNASQAAGLGACTEAQVGFKEETKAGRLDFTKAPQSCPNAAKIGSLEATSPLLVRRNAQHEVEVDPQSKEPILEPLHGSIYIATPFANPFGKLIAVYLVVEDEKTGIVAKLAGKGELDPQSGQITTRFLENPEVPLEDIKATIFGGPRGAFITPPTCGSHTTTTDLTPWSAPEGEDAFPEASFQTTVTPLGGVCPTSPSQLPSAFKLDAGTEAPAAGKYSPLIFKLSREDGTQRLAKIESTLPRGVIAKLAGVGTCSEADIAKARSREAPNKGALEQADPSCPASSQVGTVIGAAGAGPTPYYTTGHAYLAGPYKGAPISIVAIVPAVAGPFDLGAVISRIAVYLEPETAEVRAVSDPLPTALEGVPLDLRSVALRADRPNFSLNPTSCDEKSFGGQAITALAQAVPLAERFQVGGCKSLPYKPKMSVHLYGPTHRGAHPRLKAVVTAKAGEANTAKVSFTFPKSEFIDQSHFRTICTRVQFAAKQCPAGSVYGHVKVLSPLVDYPLEGPAYLRSSTHKLPDLVVALHGPPSQPIELDAAGRVDSVNGGLRVRFEEVPDAPFTKLIFNAQGAKKGLFQNSTNICKGTHRATLKLDAQSGKVSDSQPELVAQCAKAKSKKKSKSGGNH
jgi:hypothetical protein